MCSISGIIKMGDAPIEAESLTQLLLALQHRGTDATGIAMVTDGRLHVAKNNEAAWRFVTSELYRSFLDDNLKDTTTTVLLHTRAATKGTPYQAKNNHPVFHGRCAVIHNGRVSNDDEVFKRMGLERHADVDTDAIRAVVDKYGLTHQGVRALTNLEGGIASAIIDPETPDNLLLLRNSNPLHIAMNEDFIYFASEKQAIHIASRPWQKLHNIWGKKVRTDLTWGVFPDQSAWLLSREKGLLWHQQFKLNGFKPLLPKTTRNDVTAIPDKPVTVVEDPPKEEH